MAVVLIIGVPGSGKTTFAKRLQQYCQGEEGKIDDCNLISFDAIEAEEDLVWDENSFKLIRSKCLQRISDTIQSSMVKSVSIPHCNGSIDTDDGLIIVDDIMYLRSMRRELYVITRDHGVPLVTVWMKSCLDVCLARNRSRNDRINTSNDDNNATSSCCIDRHITESIHSIDKRTKLVTDDTILRIHCAFEEPTSEFIFDRHYIVVDSDSVDSTLDHAFQWIIATKNRLIEEHRSKSIVKQSLVRWSSGAGDVLTLSVTKELDEKLRDIISKVMSEVMSLMKLKSRDDEDGDRVVEIIVDDTAVTMATLSIDCRRYSTKEVGKLLSQVKSNILQLSRSSSSGEIRLESFVELFIKSVKEGLS